jgi:hypothetical protein
MSGSSIQAVVFREEERWVVQCLEYDIATQADSMDGLYDKLGRVLIAYLGLAAEQGTVPFAGIPPAPRRYWEMYRGARLRLQPVAPERGPEASRVPALELRAVA